MDCMEPVEEQKFEVLTDVHGTSEGPKLGRQRIVDKVNILCHCYILYLLALY